MAFTRLVATQQFDEAAMVLGQYGPTMLIGGHGEGITIFARHHADAVDAHPDTWFVLALERWLANDTFGASHWLDHMVEHPDALEPRERSSVRDACVGLMRARMGSEPLDAAMSHALSVVRGETDRSEPQPLTPLLYVELGVAQTLTGELAEAETNLSMAVSLCQTRGLTTLEAATLSHLALNLHMQGRERCSGEVADAALRLMAGEAAWKPVYINARATLARDLARLNDAAAGTRCLGGRLGARSRHGLTGVPLGDGACRRSGGTVLAPHPDRAPGIGVGPGHRSGAGAPAAFTGNAPRTTCRWCAWWSSASSPTSPTTSMPCRICKPSSKHSAPRGEAALLDGMRHELAGKTQASSGGLLGGGRGRHVRPTGY